MFGHPSKDDSTPHPQLSPLTPEFIESEHAVYVNILNSALKDERIQNIALSGNYGVGKSSILRKVAEGHKDTVLELSLSTLAPVETPEGEDGPPPQAITPTNTIQQEIVKQLLYREKPRRTPGSHFKRIEKFHWAGEILLSGLMGGTLAIAFLLAGWTSKVAAAIPQVDLATPWSHVVVLCVGVITYLLLRYTLYGRLNVKEFSAGAATVKLDEKSVSYFDQYLDEIVYFFEVSKRRVVIFEDIDRFNDARIFETLRSLNSLLNASQQIKGRVYFIYAVKDSIFDRLTIAGEGRRLRHDLSVGDDPAAAEIARANRTKFFDLVVPVVPFITHQNARNLALKLLNGISHDVDLEIIDLASRYVPDMRLLKNVRNEFIIFRDRVMPAGGGGLKLRETELFAMMLYKSTHLSDFEALRIGKSNLDRLYSASRELIKSNLHSIQQRITTLQRAAMVHDSIESRSAELGKRLTDYISFTVKAAGRDISRSTFSLNGNSTTSDDFLEGSFWTSLITSDGDQQLTVIMPPRNHYDHQISLSFSRTDLELILGRLDPAAWSEIDISKNKEDQEKLVDLMRFVKNADFRDLLLRDDLTIDGKKAGQSLDGVAVSILGNGLAYQLLKGGHISRDFTLYTATFHGDRVSSSATNYIIHHIDRDLADESFALNGDDVESILRERSTQFGEPVIYNNDILDHLLKLRPDHSATDMVIKSIARLGRDQRAFLAVYLRRGSQREALIGKVTSINPRFIDFIATEDEIEREDRLNFVSTALLALNENSKYSFSDAVADLLRENYEELDALTSEHAHSDTLEVIVNLLRRSGVVLGSLVKLSAEARRLCAKQNVYEVSLENLRIVLSTNSELSLDDISLANSDVYRYVLTQLPRYLSCIDGEYPSVRRKEKFSEILRDVGSSGASSQERIIELAATECVLESLDGIPVGMWCTLAREARFIADIHNIGRYLQEVGGVDGDLVFVLRREEAISGVGGRDDAIEEKKSIAKAILEARDILTTTERCELCAGLLLKYYIDPKDIEPEEGDLFAELVQYSIVKDTPVLYGRIQNLSWPTKAGFIRSSKNFEKYMTPELIGGDLGKLLTSSTIKASTKDLVIENYPSYADATDVPGLLAIGQYAAESGAILGGGMIQRLAVSGMAAELVLKLLASSLGSVSAPEISAILIALGNQFERLTVVGKDRPKIPKSPYVASILGHLADNGLVVSSFKEESDHFKVNKKRK